MSNADDVEEYDDIDDLCIEPSSCQLYSPPFTEATPTTSSGSDLSDEDSMFSLRPEESFSDGSIAPDRDGSDLAMDVYDSFFLGCGEPIHHGLILTTMDTTDLFEPEVRINIPRSNQDAKPPAHPIIPHVYDQDLSSPNIQTMLDPHLFETPTNVRVRLPGMPSPEEHTSILDDTPRPGHGLDPYWNVPNSQHVRRVRTVDYPEVAIVTDVEWSEGLCRIPEVNGHVNQYSQAGAPLQYTDLDVFQRSADFMDYPQAVYGNAYTFAPDSYSYWSTGMDVPYNDYYDSHDTMFADPPSTYSMWPADMTVYGQPTNDEHAQAATLLSILNASSIPYTPASQPTNGSISCLEDPPIVKLAPIGYPTARPTPSSYHWPRSCGSSPNPSPLASPPSLHMYNEQAPPWPPLLSAQHN
ncbi:hypothetical protein NM688_g220 [Phlebia brevispora]|uniref:Uncharacterized protein n=1 Tax=Phlebia brevispora TaxID=194682 RepID=A0ACC1TFQ7_9APHY|nr:hypothetical protein NM688_g220 [Phlebia brevispora]